MFDVIFYHDRNGNSPVEEYLDALSEKSITSKDARVNRNKILAYLQALSIYGTRLGAPYVKHIEGDIWELRPLSNRIFFFYWQDKKFVLLSYFVKKSKKTPPEEIEKAKKI